MAFTATTSPVGITPLRTVAENEVISWPGDPGVTFAPGESLVMSNGVLALGTDSSTNIVGFVAEKTIVCPAASQAFPVQGPGGGIGDLDGAAGLTLVPFHPTINPGTRVWRATFANYQDEDVAAWSASTRSITVTTGNATDDYGNGALIYVYEGPGKGELNIQEDYDHTGGNVELEVITHRNFKATLTSASKIIALHGKNAATDGRSLLNMGRMDLDTVSTMDMDDGYDDGLWCIYADWMSLVEHLDGSRYQLTIPMIKYSDFV